MQGVLSCLLAAAAVSFALTPEPAAASGSFGSHVSGHGGGHFRPHRPVVRHGFDHRFVHLDRRFHRFDGHRRFGFFPQSYLDATPYPTTNNIVIENQAVSYPYSGIPSVADLPVSTGMASQTGSEPAIYVINGSGREPTVLKRLGSVSRGPKIVTVDSSDAPNVPADVSAGGPRIIHLDVPVGR